MIIGPDFCHCLLRLLVLDQGIQLGLQLRAARLDRGRLPCESVLAAQPAARRQFDQLALLLLNPVLRIGAAEILQRLLGLQEGVLHAAPGIGQEACAAFHLADALLVHARKFFHGHAHGIFGAALLLQRLDVVVHLQRQEVILVVEFGKLRARCIGQRDDLGGGALDALAGEGGQVDGRLAGGFQRVGGDLA